MHWLYNMFLYILNILSVKIVFLNFKLIKFQICIYFFLFFVFQLMN